MQLAIPVASREWVRWQRTLIQSRFLREQMPFQSDQAKTDAAMPAPSVPASVSPTSTPTYTYYVGNSFNMLAIASGSSALQACQNAAAACANTSEVWCVVATVAGLSLIVPEPVTVALSILMPIDWAAQVALVGAVHVSVYVWMMFKQAFEVATK